MGCLNCRLIPRIMNVRACVANTGRLMSAISTKPMISSSVLLYSKVDFNAVSSKLREQSKSFSGQSVTLSLMNVNNSADVPARNIIFALCRPSVLNVGSTIISLFSLNRYDRGPLLYSARQTLFSFSVYLRPCGFLAALRNCISSSVIWAVLYFFCTRRNSKTCLSSSLGFLELRCSRFTCRVLFVSFRLSSWFS